MADGFKKSGKTVGVYLGPRGCPLDEIMYLICLKFRLSQSELIRKIFLDKLADWKLLDRKTKEPIPESVAALRAEVEQWAGSIPKSLI